MNSDSFDNIHKVLNPARNLKKEDYEKLGKLRAYESKSWLFASTMSSKIIAPYIRTVRKGELEIEAAKQISKGSRFADTILIGEEVWDYKVFQTLKINLLNHRQLLTAIFETADKLKSITDSDLALVYIIDPITNDIFRITNNFGKLKGEESWKVGPGSILAAFVADTKEFYITDDVYGDLRFPKAMNLMDIFIYSAMAVPVASPNKEVNIVLEFARTVQKDVYSWNDLNSVISTTTWIGQAIFHNNLSLLKLKHSCITQHILRTITRHSMSYEVALAETMVFVKYVIGAQKAAFFVVCTEDSRHMYADFYEEVRENKLIAVQKRVLITEEEFGVGEAAITKQIINIKNFTVEVLKSNIKYSGKPIKSTLCLPIVRTNDTLGVLQLINKKNGQHFTEEDELMIQNFTCYFIIILNFISTKKNVEKKESELVISKELLLTHFEPCKHDKKNIVKKLEKLPENFMTFMWYPIGEYCNMLAELSLVFFREALGENFMEKNNMNRFILIVRKFYRQIPYHNFQHAFSAAHTMANIICRNQNLFSQLEKIALMIASICLDLDHRGYTNSFIYMTNHSLSYLYDCSPLENHHFSMTKKIMEKCKMCTYLKRDIFVQLMSEIESCIIVTDMSHFIHCRSQLVQTLKNKQFSWTDEKCRKYVKSLLMTACDYSFLTKPYHVSKQFTEAFHKEAFNQGDMEKKMGLVPIPTMDRDNKKTMPENQVQFLNTVVLPCWYLIAKLIPSTAELFEGCRNLRKQWREIIIMSGNKVWYPDESFIEEYE